MTIERIRTFDDIATWLGESKQRYRVDAAAHAADVTVTKPAPLTGTLHIQWEPGTSYVQLDYPFVLDVPADRIRAVETAIVHANNTIALPGLAFDYAHRNVHMRLAVAMYDDGMLASSFKAEVFGVLGNARDFTAAFQEIVAGKPGEQVMQLALAAASAGGGAEA